MTKLKGYQHLIITEHLPSEGQLKVRNADKIHGGGIRLGQDPGSTWRTRPSRWVISEVFLEVPGSTDPVKDGVMRTTAYRMG